MWRNHGILELCLKSPAGSQIRVKGVFPPNTRTSISIHKALVLSFELELSLPVLVLSGAEKGVAQLTRGNYVREHIRAGRQRQTTIINNQTRSEATDRVAARGVMYSTVLCSCIVDSAV